MLFLFLLVVHPSIMGLVVLDVLSRYSCLQIVLIWVVCLAVKLVGYRGECRLCLNLFLFFFKLLLDFVQKLMVELGLLKFLGKGQYFQNSNQLFIFDFGFVHIMFYGPSCVCDLNL